MDFKKFSKMTGEIDMVTNRLLDIQKGENLTELLYQIDELSQDDLKLIMFNLLYRLR